MKKFFPLVVIMLCAAAAFAGTFLRTNTRPAAAFPLGVRTQIEHAKIVTQNDYNVKEFPNGNVQSFNSSNAATPFAIFRGDSVGITWYDAQTYNSMPNRCINYAGGSGTIGMIGSVDNVNSNFSTAGTYIAVNGGSGFAPLGPNGSSKWKSIQSDQRWYCAMASLNNLGSEVIVANGWNALAQTMSLYIDDSPEDGKWTARPIPLTDSCVLPSIAISDSSVIQLLYMKFGATGTNALIYRTSKDTGKTWSVPDTIAFDVNGGAYAITAYQRNVAIVYNSLGGTIQTLVSYDNGNGSVYDPNVWAAHGFYADTNQHYKWFGPAVFHDTSVYNSDTIITFSDHLDALIDKTGKLYIAASLQLSYLDSVTKKNTLLFYSSHNSLRLFINNKFGGINFFSTDSAGKSLNFAFNGPVAGDSTGQLPTSLNVISIGRTPTFVGWPQFGYNSASGALYMVYGTYLFNDYKTMTIYGNSYNCMYAHIFGTASTDGGATWTPPAPLSPNGVDAQFPSLADNVDDHFVLAYQADYIPGSSVDYLGAGLTNNVNAIVAYAAPTPAFTSDVHENKLTPGTFALAQNYPNPVQQATWFQYSLNTPGNVALRVYDVLGREVGTVVTGNQSSGIHTAMFDATNLPNGVYTYTLTANGKTSANTMIVAR